jgi:hypothetical protein
MMLYRMRQAIEEGLILDVIRNYTTYQTYWKLLKTAQNDPTSEARLARQSVATGRLRSVPDTPVAPVAWSPPLVGEATTKMSSSSRQ